MNRESKCCMEWLIGKLPSISTTTKSFKISKIECIHSRLPKNAKSHFGRFGHLGVKTSRLVFKPLESYMSCCKEFMSSMWTATWQAMAYLLVTIMDLYLQIAKHPRQSRQISYMAH
jgi:hypothetical protein